jgi:hypothetical protein
MNMNGAMRIALKAIDREIRRVTIQANIYQDYKLAGAKHDWEYRNDLWKAKEILGNHVAKSRSAGRK